MRRWREGLVFLISLLVALGSAAPTWADTISASQTITVRAVVAPQILVILDGQNNILEVEANSNQNVPPLFFRGSLAGTQVASSLNLLNTYRKLVYPAQLKPGLIYKASPVAVVPASAKLSLSF